MGFVVLALLGLGIYVAFTYNALARLRLLAANAWYSDTLSPPDLPAEPVCLTPPFSVHRRQLHHSEDSGQRRCLKQGGVKTWYGPGAAAPAASEATASTTSAPAPAAAPAAAPARTTASNASTAAPAPANPTDVWVNLSTKAYHCPGAKYYGTTKHGKYMSEADARAAGFHASYGKACS
jgi:hypothetical protein